MTRLWHATRLTRVHSASFPAGSGATAQGAAAAPGGLAGASAVQSALRSVFCRTWCYAHQYGAARSTTSAASTQDVASVTRRALPARRLLWGVRWHLGQARQDHVPPRLARRCRLLRGGLLGLYHTTVSPPFHRAICPGTRAPRKPAPPKDNRARPQPPVLGALLSHKTLQARPHPCSGR